MENDVTGQNIASVSEELHGEPASEYALTNPLEIGVQLRNLATRGEYLAVRFSGEQIITRILSVDVSARTFTFDGGQLEAHNRRLGESVRCEFEASPNGVRVLFATDTPRRLRFEEIPTFEVAFPKTLYYVQRREYFRVETPLVDPFLCRGTYPDGRAFQFDLHDLSLSGIAIRTADSRAADLPLAVKLADVELLLGPHGSLTVELQLVSNRAVALLNGKEARQLGFRFVDLPGMFEPVLQRVITQLEMKRR